MEASIAKPRDALKSTAPRIHQMQIDAEKIGALIGPGGKNIKRITEVTGAQIDINEDNSGRISIYAADGDAMKRAIEEVELITAEIEVGKTYKGIVRSIKDFGAFVECIPGQEGLVHISELADFRVEKTEDVCQLGDEIMVKCIGKDNQGKVRLSRKAAICEQQGIPYEAPPKPESRGRGGDRGGRGGRGGGGGGRGRSNGGGRR